VGPEGGAKPDIAAAQSGTVPRLGIDEVWAIGDEIVVTGAAFTPNLVINLHQVRDGAPRNLGGVSEAGLVRIPYKFISPNRLTFIRPGSLESGTATVQLIALPYSEGTASEGVSVRIDPPTAGERRLYRRATPGGEGAGRAR